MYASSKRLPIFHAGSLTAPFARVNAEFKTLHPDVEIVSEAAGSVDAVRKITDQKRECGVLASADYKLIPKMMFPSYALWYIIFASDEMVITFSDKSKYHDEVNADNWHEILLRHGVTYALQNPGNDPGGYRVLMVWQLAEKYYGVPQLYDKLRNSSGCRILPQTEQMDYTFSYRSGAVRNNTKHISLPESINLSSSKYERYYSQAKVEIKDAASGGIFTLNGEPILFGLTIPRAFSSQELAISWVDFLLSNGGIAIMESMGMKPVRPAITNDALKLPELLKAHIK